MTLKKLTKKHLLKLSSSRSRRLVEVKELGKGQTVAEQEARRSRIRSKRWLEQGIIKT